MPRGAERAMLGCFQVARRPSLSYEEGSASAPSTSASPPTSSASTSSPAFLDDDDALYLDDAEPEPDAGGLSTAIAARRFFLASPGRSNSIVDSIEHPPASPARDSNSSNVRALRRAATSAFPASAAASASSSSSSSSATAATKAPFRDDGMQPVRKVSLSTDTPRADFLKSMVEMVEALGLDPRRRDADLACLHDLLLCYIALNERDALRDILGAFSDLMSLLDLDGGKQGDAAPTAATAGGGEKRSAGVQDSTASG
ncbi:hypothetical protein SEVIR_9G245300v4 [Setaria viridis]|uniref:Transcription repressor n=1 Tax=Setaria viridis TaxID=4556 RepID=A0A4U6SYV3_SETVI|nr:transcription repressor OFP12-like [Setaria viridis]TKV93731.1 hypothetical protein SEVIR_9G245300v2 [Setaria viridis]